MRTTGNGGGSAAGAPGGLGFGTWPVFLASLCTILGAILFLRFGYAVGHVGLFGALGIIALGHLVTIPTALAVAEIATNRRVAGGGSYYIVSRSFGASIGGTIGIALYLSEGISVAFYLVAFAEAFQPAYAWVFETWGITPDPRWVSVPAGIGLMALVLVRGANLGVSALRVVAAILAASIGAFLLGEAPDAIRPDAIRLNAAVAGGDDFATVFAICFPAFTGMIAGVGLSGDLQDPKRSIPLGTIAATLVGMVIYAVAAVKLAASATPEALAEDQLIMAQIALWGPAIFIGLGAAAMSSALGSILVAPRTLQALARDGVLPFDRLNRKLGEGRGEAGEPIVATMATGALMLTFVLVGELDFIAQILSMFFLVTYGALCAVSFLEYFAANPSYRPTFRSRWYISLLGAVMCGIFMLRMSAFYALVAAVMMAVIYVGLRRTRREERGLQAIFRGAMFQLTRWMQITLQRNRARSVGEGWRPAIVALTRFGEQRIAHFDTLRWLCHRHGFGQFVQFVEGDFSPESKAEAQAEVGRLIDRASVSHAGVFVDALVSPSHSAALAQTLQLRGLSGLPNNTLLLECDARAPEEIGEVAEGARAAADAGFNVLVLRSSPLRFGYRSSIHVWITERGLDAAPMMILLAYILVGHRDWKHAQIQVFVALPESEPADRRAPLDRLLQDVRLPIARQNVISVPCGSQQEFERAVRRRSSEADLVLSGLGEADLDEELLRQRMDRVPDARDTLFAYASEPISID